MTINFFYREKDRDFLLFKIVFIMWAIEWFNPNNYWKNTKKQQKIAEKSDIRQNVVYKVVSVGFFCIEKHRAFFIL